MSLKGCRQEIANRIKQRPGYEDFEFIFVDYDLVFYKKKFVFVMVTYDISIDDVKICYLSSPEVAMLYNHLDESFKVK